MPESPLL